MADIKERLITARIGLLLKHPFFGNMATRLQLVESNDWLPTAATDGRNFFYNTEFFKKLTEKQCEFLFGHEVLHNVFTHILRRGDRDPQLWNIACDYAVNQILTDERIGEMPTGDLKGFQDDKYKDWSAEAIYDDIHKKAEKNGKDFLKKLGKLLDEHLDLEDKPGNGKDDKQNKDGKGPKPLSQEEIKKLKDEIKDAMISSAQAAGVDKTPAQIRKIVQQLTEPKMNWRELLQTNIQSVIKSDYSFMRPNRRGWHMDAVLPGMMNDDTIDLCVAIDTSGSISNNQVQDFLSEIQGIMAEYKDYKIHLWCFDTEVHNPQLFTADNLADIMEYEPKGFGGTDFGCNWTWMKENGVEPKKFVMFTDGYTWEDWGDPDYCDTLFIMHEKNHPIPTHGQWVVYEE